MIDRGKYNLLGVLIDAVDYNAAIEHILRAAHRRESLTVSASAVHSVMTGTLDAEHRYRLNRIDLVVPDGQPVRWALNLLYRTGLPERVYGPTLMLKVCERAAQEGLAIYLYGTQATTLAALERRLRARFPQLQIAGATPSFFRSLDEYEQEQIDQAICASGAAVVFVGLGCPRQEVWVYEHRERLPIPLIAVGAAFDFHAGLLPQAPAWMQQAGLEWLFRLLIEPRRLWRRYLSLNPLYIWMVLLQALGLIKLDPQRTCTPACKVRYG